MGQLQYWFERIANVTNEERQRVAFAKALFEPRIWDTSALQTPACWRRARKTIGGRGAADRG